MNTSAYMVGARAALLGSLLALPAAALAHGAIDEQIELVTEQIEQHPTSAALFLKRAELHRVLRNWDAALADYDRSSKLAPGLSNVDFCRGRMLLEAGRAEEAKAPLDRFLRNEPDHAEALITRARILVSLGEPASAVRDFSRGIAQLPAPDPQYYVESAQAAASQGPEHVDEALAGLDRGIAALGPLASLDLPAIDLELTAGRYEAALARLARLAEQSRHKETWLTRRGEILQGAGRREAAREAFAEALAAIESLPPARRRTPATVALEQRLRVLVEAPITADEIR